MYAQQSLLLIDHGRCVSLSAGVVDRVERAKALVWNERSGAAGNP